MNLYHQIALLFAAKSGIALGFESFSLPSIRRSLSKPSCHHMPKVTSTVTLYSSLDSSKIELQSDDTKFGRGEFHLSALIDEGDVVVYQTGSWLVDGVVVGEDGAIPSFALAKIDNIQVVWTHNCEHGVLRGLEVGIDPHDNTRVTVSEPLEDVEFGPEQLLARLPVLWEEEGGRSNVGVSNIPLEEDLWWPDTKRT